jgi:anaerobic magnesium-protoporphyrin IX monomethyl ester cyclase
MKIILLYPMWTGSYTGVNKYFARKAGGAFPPLNMALLAAIAQKQGHHVEIIDAEVGRLSKENVVRMVLEKKADLISMSGMSPFFHLSKEIAIALKEKGEKAKICIGGPHITIVEEQAFDKAFDFAFIGDAEESWPKFLKVYSNNESLETVPGLMYRVGGRVLKNEKVSVSRNLDIYPRPAYELLDMSKYFLGTLRGRLNFATIQTIRGCPWKCIFCASDQLDTTRISKRSIESVVDEMGFLVSSFGIRHFMFVDDVLTLQRSRAVDLCNAIIDRNLKITFEGSTRANLLDEDLVLLMKKAGLIRLSFGLETVDKDMRETMKKEVPLEAYREANALLNKYDIEALNSVMIGLPGETVGNVRKTLKFLRETKDIKQANFAIAVPYPGTEFHEMAVQGQDGVELISDDFSEYKRYGNAVTKVNGLTPKDLVRLQNEGFVSVYSRYWRWWPVVQKNGFMGLVLTFYRLLILLVAKAGDRIVAFNKHPSLE